MRLVAVWRYLLPVVWSFGVPGIAHAQAAAIDRFIAGMRQMHEDATLCVEKSSPARSIREQLVSHLQASGAPDTVTPETLARAMWERFPCPFSPLRPEVRRATAQDIEGVWLFPETSQKLRFPARSSRQPPAGGAPVKCDAVGYYPGGELRHAVVAGQTVSCPFLRADDLEAARHRPKVSTWTMTQAGRVEVARTDVADHLEAWEVFVVTTPFVFDEVAFAAGDLLAYVRQENGNDLGMATQFRHLRRLP